MLTKMTKFNSPVPFQLYTLGKAKCLITMSHNQTWRHYENDNEEIFPTVGVAWCNIASQNLRKILNSNVFHSPFSSDSPEKMTLWKKLKILLHSIFTHDVGSWYTNASIHFGVSAETGPCKKEVT